MVCTPPGQYGRENGGDEPAAIPNVIVAGHSFNPFH